MNGKGFQPRDHAHSAGREWRGYRVNQLLAFTSGVAVRFWSRTVALPGAAGQLQSCLTRRQKSATAACTGLRSWRRFQQMAGYKVAACHSLLLNVRSWKDPIR
jgi:hypothetical protein